jgi:hypothetical protein
MEQLKSTLLYMELNNKARNGAVSDRNLTERRFKTLLYYLRLVGIPLNKKSASAVNIVYNGFVIVCFYITIVSIYTDSYVHRHELGYVMKKIRVLLGMNLVTWLHFSFRYDTFIYSVITFLCIMPQSWKVAVSIPNEVIGFFTIDLILPASLWSWDWLSLKQK